MNPLTRIRANSVPQIAIIDPALGRTGAHNRGFALLLARQGMVNGEIGVWCNKAIDTDLREQLTGSGVVVVPTFDIDFYKLIMKTEGGVAEHWDWIYDLANQYQEAFEKVLDHWPRGAIHLIHHTLSWEHANALALAIELMGDAGSRLRHLVFLMFSPGMDQDGRIYDARRVLNYRLAFHSLAGSHGVSLHAACREYALAYAKLLQRSEPLPIHPCFLDDWRTPPPERDRSVCRAILLYAGEIKRDKGFYQLPQKLGQLLQTTGADTRIVIQFVAIRNEASRRVVEQLERLAGGNGRVDIHHGFWTDEQLTSVLGSVDMLCLDYDGSSYQHATSGLLWMAAWYGVPVKIPRGCWLQREAERLGMETVAMPGADRGPVRIAASSSLDRGYFDALFAPFSAWLDDVVARDRDPGTQQQASAVDVVFFWKQNDTGLYGRRSDMIIRYLASRPDVRRVLVVDAPIGDANLAKMALPTPTPTQNQRIHAAALQRMSGAWDAGKVSYHVYVCPLAKYRFRNDGTSRPPFIDGYIAYLSGVFTAKSVEPGRALFWMYPTNFHALALMRHFQPARVVSDVEDDQREFPGVSEAKKERMTRNYRDMLRHSDAVIANCEPLREAMADYFPCIGLIPNGCDADPPRAIPQDNPVFDEFMRFPGKTIGFVGNLESKIDTALLQKLANRFRDCQIVLLGSTHANPDVFAVTQNPNVRMPGVAPYPEVDAWLRKFDVGLVPHLVNELTRSMNPQKIYAYLSSHVPVVSTDVSNIPRDTTLVKIAATHEQFLDEVARLLEHGRPAAGIFNDYIARNSWEERLSGFVDGLDLGHISG